jgi:hypothetical protein
MILHAEGSTLLYNVVALQYIIDREEEKFLDESGTDDRKARPQCTTPFVEILLAGRPSESFSGTAVAPFETPPSLTVVCLVATTSLFRTTISPALLFTALSINGPSVAAMTQLAPIAQNFSTRSRRGRRLLTNPLAELLAGVDGALIRLGDSGVLIVAGNPHLHGEVVGANE